MAFCLRQSDRSAVKTALECGGPVSRRGLQSDRVIEILCSRLVTWWGCTHVLASWKFNDPDTPCYWLWLGNRNLETLSPGVASQIRLCLVHIVYKYSLFYYYLPLLTGWVFIWRSWFCHDVAGQLESRRCLPLAAAGQRGWLHPFPRYRNFF
jgi:hypothetical protein